jgi:hypothetical protein
VFPFPCILQHYAEFDIHTIATLEKLLGVGSFGDSMNHLACCQAIFVFSSTLSLPYVVWIVAPYILGVLGIDFSYTCHSFLVK